MRTFAVPLLALVAGVALVGFWGGPRAAVVAALLAVMEVSLSFDNAVVNAAVLRRLSPRWQRAFLTWGILVAVFGMRLVFPVLIVAAATGLGMADVAALAVRDPAAYARHLEEAHVVVACFGGMFLLLVFLHFVIDRDKDTHWIGPVERRLAALGRVEAVEIAVALGVLLGLQTQLPEADRLAALTAGVVGVASFVAVKGLAGAAGAGLTPGDKATVLTGAAGLPLFLYLEVLDASFSLDGVVGAFAMTRDVVTILVGLGVGALFVRTMTVALVQRGSLDEFVYLEHGAHWGIGALAVIMLAGTRYHVSEVVTGLVGVGLIAASVWSSVRHRRRARGRGQSPPVATGGL